jgi:hypothetical protein
MLDAAGEIQEHLAGVEDYIFAEAAWRMAIARWPDAHIILRQGARGKKKAHDVGFLSVQGSIFRSGVMQTSGG